MNLVDSSGWLEYFAGAKNAKNYAPAIEDLKHLIVSTINLYEVYKKVLSEKNEQMALTAISVMQQANVVDVTPEIALHAAKISVENKIPMADSIIYATALSQGAILWTQDEHFRDIENVKYFEKQ